MSLGSANYGWYTNLVSRYWPLHFTIIFAVSVNITCCDCNSIDCPCCLPYGHRLLAWTIRYCVYIPGFYQICYGRNWIIPREQLKNVLHDLTVIPRLPSFHSAKPTLLICTDPWFENHGVLIKVMRAVVAFGAWGRGEMHLWGFLWSPDLIILQNRRIILL
jgi:hypothetical protein